MLFTGYYDSFIQILGETAWWHTAPKSAQITDVSCNAVNIAPSALQVLGAVGWAVNVNWRLRWHRSACACMGRAGSASLGCGLGPRAFVGTLASLGCGLGPRAFVGTLRE
jgi:hypothetical protein